MIPLKTWYLPKQDKACDLSELTTDSIGQLYMLSQTCRKISMLNKLTTNTHQISSLKEWSLPKQLKKAEALTILEKETKFIIGIDEKENRKDNIFFLNAVP